MELPDVHVLVRLGEELRRAQYRFVTVTPETHRRVLARCSRPVRGLADVFGWNLPFEETDVPAVIMDLLSEGGLVDVTPAGLVSLVRFASLEGCLYAHSAFPTDDVDAVFFGPDTYRFARAIRHAARRAKTVVDVGCGTGAGGIVAGSGAERIVLADINERALLFARANAGINGVTNAQLVKSDVLSGVRETPDLVVANPPYLLDSRGRTYRDGGGEHGEALAVRIVEEAVPRLAPGGTLVLYTGSAIVGGVDTFHKAVAPFLERCCAHVAYEEVDPDVFGEELSLPSYAAVDRIAAVVLEVTSR